MYKNYTKELGMPLRLQRYIAKLLLIMRLTTLIMIISLIQVSAATLAQKLSLNRTNAPLKAVLKDIRTQSGYDFIITESLLEESRPVTINIKDAELKDALEQVFQDQKLTYSINKTTITIKEKPAGLLENLKAAFAAIDAHGTIIDEQNRPVPGATVKLKNGKGVTITDEKGQFSLKNCNEGDIIIITFIGYNAKEVTAKADIGTIKLEQATSALDQVVVRAYGETSQRLSVGNISTITAKQIENKPVTNALLALQGEVPGIFITQSSGFSNSGVNVQVQGPNSIAAGNYPLYIVDGVPYANQNMESLTGAGAVLGISGTGNNNNNFGGKSGNPLNFLNPQDIESISILKDADATAIYGSRAANGAVIITTKKGKAGASKVSLNLQQGMAQNTRFLDVMNTEQYLSMRKYAYFTADGLTTSSPQYATQYDINGLWDQSRNTNWQKTLFGNTAHYTNLQGSLSGGTVLDQYLLSGNYNRQTVVYHMPDLANQKGSFHISLNHASNNQKFKAQFSAQYMMDVNRLPAADLTGTALRLAPDAPPVFNADGSLNWAVNSNGQSSWQNPLSYEKKYLKSTVGNLVSSFSISYELAKSLKISSLFGYTNIQQDEIAISPTTANPPEYASSGGRSQFSSGKTNLWNIEPHLNYSSTLWKGKLDVLIGGTYQKSDYNQQLTIGSGYSTDLILQQLSAAGSTSGYTYMSQYRYIAAYSRLSYNWEDKYLLDLNGRRDGSSRFGDNNKFHDFWSLGAGWIFSNETGIKDNLPWLSFGKLHGSYGTTGNDNIGDYTYLNSYNVYNPNGQLYQNSGGLAPAGLPNPNLQWEVTNKLSGGISLGFLKDRILFNLDYYRNQSSNQLLSYSLPSSTGFTGVKLNFPATVQNTGLEASLQGTIFKSDRFSWKSSLNISANRNKLISFPGLANSSYYNTLVVGQPIDMVKVFRFAGLNTQTGLYQVVAANGSITSSPNYSTDMTAIISQLPKYYGGLRNDFSYGNFQLSFLIQFTKQIEPNNFALIGFVPGSFNANQPVSVMNYWKAARDQAQIQQISATYSNANVANAYYAAVNSNGVYSNGSYARLKNVSLSYLLNKYITQKLAMQECRIFVNAQNLLTVTSFKGLDPETGNAVLPPLRTITLGIQAGF